MGRLSLPIELVDRIRCTQDRNNGIIMTALTSLGLTGRSIPSYSVRL